jgi:hypothetical protein
MPPVNPPRPTPPRPVVAQPALSNHRTAVPARAQVPPALAMALKQPVTAEQRQAGKAIPLVKGGKPAPLAKQAVATAKPVGDAAKLALVDIEEFGPNWRVYAKDRTLLYATKHGYADCVAWVNAASFAVLKK